MSQCFASFIYSELIVNSSFIARSNVRFMCSIYKLHDEAKDKAFELEMSWICEESKREHQKVIFLKINSAY